MLTDIHKRAVSFGLCGLLMLLCGACASITEQPPTIKGKKIIKLYGIDKPSTSYLRQHVAELEEVPLDGICIVVRTDQRKPNDTNFEHGNYLWFTSTPLRREDFAQAIRDLKQTRFSRFHFNFMQYTARGVGKFDWFDQDGWNQVVENARVAAWASASQAWWA